MFADQKVLFMFAHMDDETISSYGTIRRAVDEGAEVVVYCACGLGRFPATVDDEQVQDERRAIFERYGHYVRFISSRRCSDLSLTRYSAQKIFDETIRQYMPSIVVTHWTGDLHFEHRFLSQASLVSCRRVSGSPVRQLWHASSPMERWTYGQLGRPFTPNLFVDTKKYEHLKRQMLDEYAKCELPEFPDLRSAESVIQYDRQNGRVAGLETAEAYFKVFEVA